MKAGSRKVETLKDYCRAFTGAQTPWPELPLIPPFSLAWWQHWLMETPEEHRFNHLRTHLPQLWIKPHHGASSSDCYKRLVLRGRMVKTQEKENCLELNDPSGFTIKLVKHPCGTYPVIEIDDHDDFRNILLCLAHRCEQADIQSSVHAQAVAGLIHWGLIRTINQNERAELIILHRAPYSSLPANIIPGKPTEEKWIQLSQLWRLEHELTHIATRRLVGEMRLNLFDELIADTLGMIKALETFSAVLFLQGIGINADGSTKKDGRVHTYTRELSEDNKVSACRYLVKRANELEGLLLIGDISHERNSLLKFLTQNQLDQPLRTTKPEEK